MSIADQLAASIRKHEPAVTRLVLRARPGADAKSVRIAVFAGLTSGAVSILGSLGTKEHARAEIDALIRMLPSSVGNDTVRLDQLIVDKELRLAAQNQLGGISLTNAPTGFSLAYNLCGERDLKRMLLLDKGPLGPLGGVAAVLSQRLVGEDKAGNIMMEMVDTVTGLTSAISGSSTEKSSAGNQGATGCIFAAMGLLIGGGGVLSGIGALVWYFV